ncbi:MAG: hypothetical protein ABSB28_01130 [Candidatus Bathyarchaeia archaeon]
MKNECRKALLITIAVDTSSAKGKGKYVPNFNGGFRGPFWGKGEEFEYIPIPETMMGQRSDKKWEWKGKYVEGGKATYKTALGNRSKTNILTYVPAELRANLEHAAIHYDPDFKNLTYGDGKKETPRGKQLAKLNPGDLLVFCPSLENPETREPDRGRFIIGSFTVECAYDFTNAEFEKRFKCTRSDVVEKYKNKNAHFSEEFARAWDCSRKELLESYDDKEEADLVLVAGIEKESGLFENAIRITRPHDGKYFVMPKDLVGDLGLKKPPGPLKYERGWKWVKGDQYLRNLHNLLKKGGDFVK